MTKILTIRETCTGCMACYNVCPENAITMREDDEGFFMPDIDNERCDNCLLCEKVCPALGESVRKSEIAIQQAYYGWHNDDDVRIKSSSGGVFSAFAEKILTEGGIVYGAVYDDNSRIVVHKSTTEATISSMRKSKYVQSYIGDAFRKVEKALSKQQKVFFVGTPCQIAGLNRFIDNQDGLITCDFICHGVPPMKLLRDEMDLLQKKYKDEIVGFDFRPKIKTWTYDYFSTFLRTKGRRDMIWEFNSFYKGFIDNLTLRKSCFSCIYSENRHEADITLADFWGYRQVDENIYDNRGLSLIMVNTEKGRRFVESCNKEMLTIKPIKWEIAGYVFKKRESNSKYSMGKRNAFFDEYKKYGYKRAIKDFGLKPNLKNRVIKYALKIKHKIVKKAN